MLVKRIKTQRCLLVILICMLFVSNRISAVESTLKWMKSSGGSNDDFVQSVLCDKNGNSYIVGHFKSTQFKVGTINLTHTYSGEPRMYIAKYDSLGNVLWAVTSAKDEYVYIHSAALDSLGNIVIGGHFSSYTATFGTNVLYNSNAYVYGKMYLAKYDKNGNALWAKTAQNSNISCAINAVSIDKEDNIYITGQFQDGTLTFANKTLQNSISGIQDVFLFKLNNNGEGVWANSLGGSGHDVGLVVTVDKNSVYVAGTYKSPILIAGTTIINNSASNGTKDLFVTKYDKEGLFKWIKKIGGADEEETINVSADTIGNLYVCGSFKSTTVNFDALNLTKPNAINTCMFLTKLNSEGVFKWTKSTSDNFKNSAINGVKADFNGNIFTTGFYQSDVLSLDNFSLVNSVSDYNEMFIARFDSLGNVLSAKSVIGFGNDYGKSVDLDSKGNVFYTGVFSGNNLITDNMFVTNNNNNGYSDVVLLKYVDMNSKQIFAKVDNLDVLQKAKIFPNPFKNEINVELEDVENSRIEVFNVVGVKIEVDAQNAINKKILNTSSLQKGFYVMKIISKDGKTDSRLLVKE